jgi:hypothetical protein
VSRLAGTLAVVAVSAAVASGVTYALVTNDAPAHKTALPPVVLAGALHDTSGKPVGNALIQLTALRLHVKAGVRIPVRVLAAARTNSAGRFTVRLSPSASNLRAMAAGNNGWVNFEVQIRAAGGLMVWSVPRKISRETWITDEHMGLLAAAKQERLTFTPLGGPSDIVKVDFCNAASMPSCHADATRAQENLVGSAVRRLPHVKKLVFVSKHAALERMKHDEPQIFKHSLLTNPLPDEWVITTTSPSEADAVGKAMCAARYPGVEPCPSPGSSRFGIEGGVRWRSALAP